MISMRRLIYLIVSDLGSGYVLVETQDTLNGAGSNDYSFNMTTPSIYGVYDLEASVSYFNGLELESSGENSVQEITLELIKPEAPSIPWVYFGAGLLIVGVGVGLYLLSKRKVKKVRGPRQISFQTFCT